MDCSEVQDLITPAIDGELEEKLKAQFHRHITECQRCRSEFELEHITKQLVRRQFQRVQAPQTLVSQIRTQFVPQSVSSGTVSSNIFGFFKKASWKIAFAACGIAAAVVILLLLAPLKSHHSHAQPKDGNIIHQSYNNFDEVLKGIMKPEITTDDPATIKSYFAQRVNFKVNVPCMKRCKLFGALFSNYGTENIVHLLYKYDDDPIYLYQTSLQAVLAGQSLKLPPSAMEQLLRTGWYVENHLPECTLVIWIADSTVCSAVADIQKDKLLASLQEGE
ncbi:MAG: zf-HC2 domain-containing protein [Ignavibacteriae bacterium]|nr:zf-HC2 domain-containing protein [Ignavibacteriota bacterium]